MLPTNVKGRGGVDKRGAAAFDGVEHDGCSRVIADERRNRGSARM
ncbi:hypothetical protein [Paramicrobacterium fandaimingii]|nr:hypothetical protein [Microbacterium fandaimingii]